ncbi:hypothetical protein BDZ91DRAFT_720801, partial [Kalaharituber pfeilii]
MELRTILLAAMVLCAGVVVSSPVPEEYGYQPDNLHVCTSLFFFSHFFCPK